MRLLRFLMVYVNECDPDINPFVSLLTVWALGVLLKK